MRQVLLSVASGHAVPRPLAPVVLWMEDDTKVGDVFMWGKRICVVSAVYGTTLSHGLEARRTERPRVHPQAGVVLDQHPG